jgi:GT2 family glycosyltransferase
MPDGISILVLAHNKSEYTRRCLHSILRSSPLPSQIVIVDNGSTDDTPRMLDAFDHAAVKHGVGVERLRFEENLGAIEGRNRGIERLTGAFQVWMDNDIVVRSRSWLERLRGVLQSTPTAGVVGPKLVYANPPHDIQCAGCTVTKGGRVSFCGRGQSRETVEWNRPRECQTLISACWMLRAEVVRSVGLLDPQFSPVQFEDIDYCYRIRETGRTCRYEPGVEMYHFENVTTGRTKSLNYSYLTVKNGLKFKRKWQHRFEKENGPADSEWNWAEIPSVQLADVPEQIEELA